MLKTSKCILHLISFDIQNICHASTRKQISKPNKIRKLMKEYKLVYGELIETRREKKKRLKLERKGKIPQQKPNKIDTELPWIMQNHSNNLKKITISVKQQSECKDTTQCSSEPTLEIQQSKETNTNQNHTDSFVNSSKTYINQKKSSKKFSKMIIRIKKPSDQNNNNIINSEYNKVTPEIQLNNTNPIYNVDSTNIKNTNNDHSKATFVTESSYFDQNTINNHTSSHNSNKKDETVNNVSLGCEKLSNIIIKNLPYFPIMSNKQESFEETKIFCISGKDDVETIKFPSVTKILMRTMPPESKLALEAWKERMIKKLGQEGFDMHQKALLEDGASLHSCIAQSLLGKEYDVPSKIEPVFKSVQCILEDVHHVKAVETHVAHPKLRYKGIIDCIASYRGENYVIDWKKSDRKKMDLRETYDAPLQIAAYIGAINSSNIYPFMIKRGLLVIGYTCGTPATVHQLCDNTLQRYWNTWLRRLQEYYVKTGSNDDNNTTLQ